MHSDYAHKRQRQLTRLGLAGPMQLPPANYRAMSQMQAPSARVAPMSNPYALIGAALQQYAGLPRTQTTSPRAMVAMLTGR